MDRKDQIAWLLFLVVLGSATVFMLVFSAIAMLE
jgi:hypothetical protein